MDTTPSTQGETSSGASFHYSLDNVRQEDETDSCDHLLQRLLYRSLLRHLKDEKQRWEDMEAKQRRLQQLDTDCRDGLPKSLPFRSLFREDMEAKQRSLRWDRDGWNRKVICSPLREAREEKQRREEKDEKQKSVHRWHRDGWNRMEICFTLWEAREEKQRSQEEETCSSKSKPREMPCSSFSEKIMEVKQRSSFLREDMDEKQRSQEEETCSSKSKPREMPCSSFLEDVMKVKQSSSFLEEIMQVIQRREDMEAKQRSDQPWENYWRDDLLESFFFREDMDEKQRREENDEKQRRVGLLAPRPTLLLHPGLGLAGYPSGLKAKLVLLSFLLYCLVPLAYSLKDEKLSFCRLHFDTSQLDCRLECQFYKDIYKGRHTFQVYHIRQEGSPDIVAEGRWIEGEYTVYTADGYEHNGTEISKVFIKIQKRSVHVGSMYACILPPVELEDVSTCHLPGEDLSNVNMALHKSSSSNEGSALLSSVPETPAVSPSSAKLTVAQDMAQLLIIAVSIITFS